MPYNLYVNIPASKMQYYLNSRQINGNVEATGLHTDDPSKWDSLKCPTQLRTIEQRFLNISPVKRCEIGFPLQDQSPSTDDQSSVAISAPVRRVRKDHPLLCDDYPFDELVSDPVTPRQPSSRVRRPPPDLGNCVHGKRIN
ncbi:hypothetical protein BLNAU_21714 [Blattamonas nauphoetae]|uniref:Uncharacterized protein n=1 Tax=Blattamonas nauphoetae TaxID=2049346 RepID=A0ABQ9WV38_9EUKA|nr:hypothetical protein BLNAU_21714 [Blattamonas nauphoetae]